VTGGEVVGVRQQPVAANRSHLRAARSNSISVLAVVYSVEGHEPWPHWLHAQ
jgi:hypothetical protein